MLSWKCVFSYPLCSLWLWYSERQHLFQKPLTSPVHFRWVSGAEQSKASLEFRRSLRWPRLIFLCNDKFQVYQLCFTMQAFLCVLGETRFARKWQNLIFYQETRFFPLENSNFRQFWANSTLQNIIWHKNLHGVTLFIAFLLSKFMGKGEIYIF